MGERLSAQEFGEWRVWYHFEQQQPAAERLRHAQLLAAAMNGGVVRDSKRPFMASEFLPDDPWAEPREEMPSAPSVATLAAQVAALNSMRSPGNV